MNRFFEKLTNDILVRLSYPFFWIVAVILEISGKFRNLVLNSLRILWGKAPSFVYNLDQIIMIILCVCMIIIIIVTIYQMITSKAHDISKQVYLAYCKWIEFFLSLPFMWLQFLANCIILEKLELANLSLNSIMFYMALFQFVLSFGLNLLKSRK